MLSSVHLKRTSIFNKLYSELYKRLTEQADYFVQGNKLKFIEKRIGELA
jgi:hypothetical protein